MSSIWVVNASPVIVLAKIDQLRLIEHWGGEYVLPDTVAAEVLSGPLDDPAHVALSRGWGPRRTAKVTPESLLEWGLGAGETSVLALALELRGQGAVAVLDDAAARTAARAMGVAALGTLGVVLRAKLKGLIPAAAPVIADLRDSGLFLDNAVNPHRAHRRG